jgi:hypothetical protein
MNLREQIDQLKYVFLTDLGETEANTLRIVIHEAKVTDETETLQIGATKITDVHPIVWDETSRGYEITFPHCVAYAVLNESFANVDKYEEYTGQFFRVYSKSHFLDYVRVATFASDDYPGKATHYEIPCLDHIVEVVCVDEPQIRDLRSA